MITCDIEMQFSKIVEKLLILGFFRIFKKSPFSVFNLLRHEERHPSNTNQHSNTLGVMLLKNNTCCFCC